MSMESTSGTDGTSSPSEAAVADSAPEVVVVPVKKFEVNITLDDLLTKVSEQASSMAAAGDQEALEPEVVERLQRLSELAGQLKTEMNGIEPTVLSRLARRRSGPG